MLDFPFQPQLAIAIAECPLQAPLPTRQHFSSSPAHPQACPRAWIALRNRRDPLSQREQFFNFVERKPQLLGMPHKFEIANPPSIEQAIPARVATSSLSESESLREAVSRRLAPAFHLQDSLLTLDAEKIAQALQG